MSGTLYVQRAIDISLTLGTGAFGTSGANTVKLSGLRAAVSLNVKSAGFSNADVRVYGAPPSVMNAASTLGIPVPMSRNNRVQVMAGDAGATTRPVIFSGTIQRAYQDFSAAPETSLVIEAWTSALEAVQPVPPTSFPGVSDVATVMAGIAAKMGRAFENSGVSVQLSNVYLPGTAYDQASRLADAADIEWHDDGATISIWPKFSTRASQIPLINAESGLVGYPSYSDQGMAFRCIYNPKILFGGQVQVESTSRSPATYGVSASSSPTVQLAAGVNGFWFVNGLTHDLSAQLPDGPWFSDVSCRRIAGAPTT